MREQSRRKWIGRMLIPALTATVVAAQTQTQTPPPNQQKTPVFTTTTELITTDVRVRDKDGKFLPNLSAKDFEIFEDGVPQKLQTFSFVLGGRVVNDIIPTATKPKSSGLVLPPSAPPPDVSGRIFIIFVDDYHIQPGDTPRMKDALKQIRDTVIHDNDLVGFVSTGFSGIEGTVNYDYKHRRFDEIIGKAMGSAMTPDDIVKANTTVEGPSGLRYRVHSTFETAYDLLNQLSKITNRRKALIYVSSGYDLNPFKDSRYLEEQRKYSTTPEGVGGRPPGEELNDPNYSNPFEKNGMQFLDTDLIADIAELVRAARRANVTFYTLDPRGLVSGIADINMGVTSQEWMATVRNQLDSLRVLGDETGGFCICNMNNYKPGLQRIDNEMSDYYVVGYVSNNPDPMKRERKIEIRVNNPAAKDVGYIQVYRIAKPKRR
jgi:VWFA-related protein